MKSVSRIIARSLFVLTLVVALCVVVGAQAQSRDAHVISARAGGINFVSGDCRVQSLGETEWRTLGSKDNLSVGDVLKTGAGGQVEVLLNPGSYFRLAENSEFALTDDALDNLRLKLSKGSAVVEATGFSELQVSIVIETPQTEVSIIRSGIYRLNVSPAGVTEVFVQKGRALVGRHQPTQVKGGKSARVGGGGVELAKLDKKNTDSLDLWSKERGKLLAQANNKLSHRNVKTLLASDWFNDFWGAQAASYNGNSRFAGVWLYNPRLGFFTFLPLYFGWGSPYGFGYNNTLVVRNPLMDIPSCYNCRSLSGDGTSIGAGGNAGTGGGAGSGSSGSPAPAARQPEPIREINRPSFEQPRTVESPSRNMTREP